MISQEQFVEIVINGFSNTDRKIDDLNKKIDGNHGIITPKIEDLCERMTKLETQKITQENINQKQDTKKYNHIFAGTGIAGTIFGLFEVLKGYVWH